mgnify:CR=1 FL=1
MKIGCFNKVVFMLVFLSLVLGYTSYSCDAAGENYNIEFVGKDFEFLETKTIGNSKINYYEITVRLTNIGSQVSDDITLAIWEENEGKTMQVKRNSTIQPSEIKKFVFSDWLVEGTGEHTVIYQYSPTNLNSSEQNSYNSGDGSFKINDGTVAENTDTPGFEFISIIIVLYLIVIFKYNKYKKK